MRCAVQLTGVFAAVLGVIVILTAPIGIGWRTSASLLWLLLSVRELRVIRNAYSRYRSLRVNSVGDVELVTRSGDHQAAILLPGSVVLPGLAWLRFEAANGLRFGEFLRGNSRDDKQWRHLQVIWRHFGATS